MAKSAVAYTFCVMVMFALAANAHPGRKMLQVSKSVDSGAGVAAQTATSANINKAIDEHKTPTHSHPGDKVAVTPKVTTGASTKVATTTGKPTTAIAAAPKSSKGTGAQGAAQASQAGTAANINKYASGAPAPKPVTPTASTVTKVVAGAPKGYSANTAGAASTNMQSATGAAINSAVDKASKAADRP